MQFQDARYHIISRGDQYGPIFLSDSDCYSFLKSPGETCQRTGGVIHACVLIDNHILVEKPEVYFVDGNGVFFQMK